MRFVGGRVGVLLFVAGCDGPSPEALDAPAPVDAAVRDEPCPYHASLVLEPYGEVRAELVRHPGGNTSARVTAHVFQDPGSTKYFPYVNLNGCTNTTDRTRWPLATNPIAERTYYDVGTVLVADGPSLVVASRQTTQGFDVMGREHPANAWYLHDGGSTADDGPTSFTPDHRHDVVFTGSSTVSPMVFEDVLYMPPSFELASPGIEPFALHAGTDLTITYVDPPSTEPTGFRIDSFVYFTGAQGPAVMCYEPGDGSLTVPAAMVDVVRAAYPAGGTIVRQLEAMVARPHLDPHVTVDGCTRAERGIVFSSSNGYESTFEVAP